jgi:hypothetical protein
VPVVALAGERMLLLEHGHCPRDQTLALFRALLISKEHHRNLQ